VTKVHGRVVYLTTKPGAQQFSGKTTEDPK